MGRGGPVRSAAALTGALPAPAEPLLRNVAKWQFGILSFTVLEGLFILFTLPLSPYPMFSWKYFLNFGMFLFAFALYKRLVLTWATTSSHRFIRI